MRWRVDPKADNTKRPGQHDARYLHVNDSMDRPRDHTQPDQSAQSLRGYPLLEREVTIAARTYRLAAPANYDELLDAPSVAARFEQDEFIPYWADLWSSAILLAEHVAKWEPIPPSDSAPTVLEIGCGLGLVGLVAAERGYAVTMTDYDDDALAFAAENARRNAITGVAFRRADWRETHAALQADRILAADVLYETRNLAPIADFVRRHLNADGFALIADPLRTTAEAFDGVARHSGLSVAMERIEPRDPDRGAREGRIFTLRHKRP